MEQYERIRRLLEVYTFEDILEYNDIEVVELLEILYNEGLIIFPLEPV